MSFSKFPPDYFQKNLESLQEIKQKQHQLIENLLQISFHKHDKSYLLLQYFEKVPDFSYFYPISPANYLPIYSIFSDKTGCTNIIMELYQTDLASDISKRIKTRKYYSEGELYRLLETLLNGVNFFHQKNKNYGDLNTSSLVIMENGEYKLLPNAFFENIKKINLYFAPEEIDIKKKNSKLQSDIFKIGLILLEAASFFSISSCFDIENHCISNNFIEKKLEIIENRYSQELKFIIKKMLINNPDERPNYLELMLLLEKLFVNNPKEVANSMKIKICPCCINKIRNKYEESISEEKLNSEKERKGFIFYINFFTLTY